MRTFLPLLLVILTPNLANAATERFEVITPRGAKVLGLVDRVAGPGARPVVVIAPGSGYHMEMPLVAGLADGVARAGLVAVRFNWAYFPSGTSSPTLDLEAEDLRAVLAHAQALPGVDPRRTVVAGKSLGSIVAYRAFRETPGLAGLLALTPVCETSTGLEGYYPGLATERRPTFWILGELDPQNCRPAVLYAGLARAPLTPASVQVVGGNHSLIVAAAPDPNAAVKNTANLRVALEGAVLWILRRVLP